MKMTPTAWLFLAISCLIAVCDQTHATSGTSAKQQFSIKIQSVERLPALDAAFCTSKTWLGGDSGYSFRVGKNRDLWLFGDTFVSENGDGKLTRMVHSTTGLLTGGIAKPGFQFQPSGFHIPRTSWIRSRHTWWWPADGIVSGDSLYAFVKAVRPGDNEESGVWNFDWFADLLVRFDHVSKDGVSSVALVKPVHAEDGTILFGTACTEDENFCYVYCSSIKDAQKLSPHPCVVARIAKKRMDTCAASDWTYWNERKQTWSASRNDASILFFDAAPEMTVTHLKKENLYVAVYIPPLDDKIMIRTATRPQGPFSNRMEIYKCPESAERVNDKPVMVYSAKAHPELSNSPDELVITYCSNPGDLEDFKLRPDLYHPRAILVRFTL